MLLSSPLKSFSNKNVLCWLIVFGIFLPGVAHSINPMYEYTVIAKENLLTGGGEFISAIDPEVSVNEDGFVSFVATIDDGTQLMVGQDPFNPENISRSPGGRNFDFPQINNQGRIITRELLSGNSLIRSWNIHNPGDSTIIASSTLSAFSQLTLPTIGNTELPTAPPIVGFLGRVGDLPFAYFANDTGMRDAQDSVSSLSGTVLTRFRSMAAASAKRTFVVQFKTNDDEGRIAVYTDLDDDGTWTATPIATTVGTTAEWLTLGTSPAISDNGKVVTFAGEHKTMGLGIYAAVTSTSFPAGSTLLKIFDTAKTIAFDNNGEPITLASFEMVNRIGILHRELGGAGLKDDSFVLSFIATPSAASRNNPVVPSRPLHFSDTEGLWSIRVDLETGLQMPSTIYPHATTPIPVIQVGDVIDGATVSSLTLYDPLALPLLDRDGLPRVPQKGDHYLAFSALTDAGVKVVRAAMLDTDGDGLMDHWETNGIDMDGDASPELDLHRMGADPLHRDIFLEIDWLRDRTSGGYTDWTNQFPPGTASELARMFAQSPVENPDGTTGITLHLDAGPSTSGDNSFFSILWTDPNSINMGDDPFNMDGGESIGLENDPLAHLDVVYFGVPNSFAVPGMHIRSFHDIKDKHFGQHDQWARSLAFKYAILVDYHELHLGNDSQPFTAGVAEATASSLTSSDDLPAREGGYVVKIISGEGAGQVRVVQHFEGSRKMFLRRPWEFLPDTTSRLALIAGWGGMGEVEFLGSPDTHSRPANDFVISLGTYGVNEGGWLANLDVFWRTIAHELGHTLGLRHGGTDHTNDKIDYLSIMNYRYADEAPSFAGPESSVFNDWAYLKYDAHHTGYYLDNTFDKNPSKIAFGDLHTPDPNVVEYEEIVGHPVDLILPTVAITSPAPGTSLPFGSDLVVNLHATDDVAIDSAIVVFDRDGDGFLKTSDERVQAVDLGGGNFTATVSNIAGPFGSRELLAMAFDTSGNRGVTVIPVVAGDDAGADLVLLDTGGTIPSQGNEGSGGERQNVLTGPISIPGTGRMSITVAGSPAVRQAVEDLERYDSAVFTVQFEGQDIALQPVCNPAGSDPALCTTYWQAPSAGSLVAEILGPAVFDTEGVFLGHQAQDYTVKIAFKAVDLTPPSVDIALPAADDFVELTETLTVRVSAADDYGIASVNISFDIDGNGSLDDGEDITATDLGGGLYQADFTAVSGEAGTRSIAVVAKDTAGNTTRRTGFVEVQIPDTTPPQVWITSPPGGLAH